MENPLILEVDGNRFEILDSTFTNTIGSLNCPQSTSNFSAQSRTKSSNLP